MEPYYSAYQTFIRENYMRHYLTCASHLIVRYTEPMSSFLPEGKINQFVSIDIQCENALECFELCDYVDQLQHLSTLTRLILPYECNLHTFQCMPNITHIVLHTCYAFDFTPFPNLQSLIILRPTMTFFEDLKIPTSLKILGLCENAEYLKLNTSLQMSQLETLILPYNTCYVLPSSLKHLIMFAPNVLFPCLLKGGENLQTIRIFGSLILFIDHHANPVVCIHDARVSEEVYVRPLNDFHEYHQYTCCARK